MSPEPSFVPRGSRGVQRLWVWTMALTANGGKCVYCDQSEAETLEHEQPVAGNGHDVWWNLLPACDRCNGWKLRHTAAEWVVDMKMQLHRPNAHFTKNTLPLTTVEGILGRVEHTRREIRDRDRSRWFEHHYGNSARPARRAEIHEIARECGRSLARYPHRPWTTPESPGTNGQFCTRRMCCPDSHPDAQMETLMLGRLDYHRFHVAAFEERLHPGDLLGNLVRRYLTERGGR
ncbi:HNH endonuclease [Streptomyces sp. NPDC049879]|uniref:HNH endonuclease n=1 Tax=Streptomyces sp. NPDC049879 TaxID=3365598 RepID=UPI00379BC2FD